MDCALRRLAPLLLLVALAACGGDDTPPAAPAEQQLIERTFPELAPVPEAERAAYAFERLVRGPKPLGPLRVPDIHRRNLEMARADLLAVELETLAILEDPAVIERYTGMARQNADPWHNILRVLLALPGKPVELVLAWTEPVLALDVAGPLLTLRREAARVLASVPDPRVGPTLLALFEAEPAEREMGVLCLPPLLRLDSPWREWALEVAMTSGSPSLWSDSATRISGLVPLGEVDPAVSDLMAWWGVLLEGSGPRLPRELPRIKHLPWAPARLALDPTVPHLPDGQRVGRAGVAYGPIPSAISHGGGWYPADLSHDAVFPMYGYLLTGKMPAAQARCALSLWRYPTYAHAVRADQALQGEDDALYWTARHCKMDADLELDDVRSELAAALDRGGPWTPARVGAVRGLIASLPSSSDPANWDLLVRVLTEMRPLDQTRTAVERAYDLMVGREPDLVSVIEKMLRSDDPATRGVGLHLIRRAREPVYLDALERWYDETEAPEERSMLRRTLTWMYSRGSGIEPGRYEAFVGRYEDWIDELDDREAAGFATGLLDFGAPGRLAFARGLQGERRAVYLAGWPRDRRIVSRPVAEAAVAPMGHETVRAETAHVLGLAYTSFPAEAASALAALRDRLPSGDRTLVDPALDRVRHRAALPDRR